MQKYKITLEYNGSYLNGWHGDRENVNLVFLEDLLIKASKLLFGVEHKFYCSSRTDAGVHATNQVCHFESDTPLRDQNILKGMNYYLPNFIRIHKVEKVDRAFHARFSAKQRTYSYLIYNNPIVSPIIFNYCFLVKKKLCLNQMKLGIKRLVGTMDLAFFCPKKCKTKTIKTIDYIDIDMINYLNFNLIQITIKGKSFFHHQVRNIVSSLIRLGLQKWTIEDFEHKIKSKNINLCPSMVPARGLYLTEVKY